jgi:hypothetical protein
MFSLEMKADAMLSVGAAALTHGIVDVSAVAEQVRLRHEHENVAREDIEALVVQLGETLCSPMEFCSFVDITTDELGDGKEGQSVH